MLSKFKLHVRSVILISINTVCVVYYVLQIKLYKLYIPNKKANAVLDLYFIIIVYLYRVTGNSIHSFGDVIGEVVRSKFNPNMHCAKVNSF